MGADAGHKRRMQESGKKEREAMLAQENRLSAKRVKEAKLKQKAMRDFESEPDPMFDVQPLDQPSNDNAVTKERRRRHDRLRQAERPQDSTAERSPASSIASAEEAADGGQIYTETLTLGVNDHD